MKFPDNLRRKIHKRIQENALRQLPKTEDIADFSSNDYLGFSKCSDIFHQSHLYLLDQNYIINGATGSRLISGNHPIFEEAETYIATFHQSETALIFNSGYDLNLGFFGCIPQKSDLILYDELCHASIRDGIQLSLAKSYKYAHNDYEDLERLCEKFKNAFENIYLVTESVFSMDGDTPNFSELLSIAKKFNMYVIVDEAHALGVFGEKGEGILQHLNLHQEIFARIVTFGKGLGCHGSVVLGSNELKSFLINFCRSFIYSTALSPHNISTILCSYKKLDPKNVTIKDVQEKISYFNQQKKILGITPIFVRSKSCIQSAIIPGNTNVKDIAKKLQTMGMNVKPILSPTVPSGQERLRICLHSYNSFEEIDRLLISLTEIIYSKKD